MWRRSYRPTAVRWTCLKPRERKLLMPPVPGLLDELAKASHRQSNTGFYFGAPRPVAGAEGFTQTMEYVGDVVEDAAAGAPRARPAQKPLLHRRRAGGAHPLRPKALRRRRSAPGRDRRNPCKPRASRERCSTCPFPSALARATCCAVPTATTNPPEALLKVRLSLSRRCDIFSLFTNNPCALGLDLL